MHLTGGLEQSYIHLNGLCEMCGSATNDGIDYTELPQHKSWLWHVNAPLRLFTVCNLASAPFMAALMKIDPSVNCNTILHLKSEFA